MRRGDEDLELRVTRRDGRPMRHEPRPVRERFDPENHEDIEEYVGKHFIPMAAAADERDIPPEWQPVTQMDWLSQYQCEIWPADGRAQGPEAVSTSTKGWFQR